MKDIIEAKSMKEFKKYIDTKGTLSTARYAFKQGKKVFIGNVDGYMDIDDLQKEVEKWNIVKNVKDG